jgi:uncharacterized protein DUF4129
MSRAPGAQRWLRAGGATVALTALSAVTAGAARAPLSRSTPIDARSAGAPTTALFTLTLGAGIVALTALGVILWPGRHGRDDEPEHDVERPEIPWYWKLVATVLPLALAALLFAAAIGGVRRTQHLATRSGDHPGGLAGGSPPRAHALSTGFVLPGWVPWAALGLLVAAIAVAAWWVWRWWREPAIEHAPDDPATAGDAAVRAAVNALASIDDPREAIIAAYVAMEDVFAAHGVRRDAAEAPREYLQRVLMAGPGDREASTLTGLFEEARFSTHAISADLRERALAALAMLQARLAVERMR